MSVPRTLLGWGLVLLLVGPVLFLSGYGLGALAFRLELYDSPSLPASGVRAPFIQLIGLTPLLVAAHTYGKAAFELDRDLVNLVLASYLGGAAAAAIGIGVLLLLHALLSTLYARWRRRRGVVARVVTEH